MTISRRTMFGGAVAASALSVGPTPWGWLRHAGASGDTPVRMQSWEFGTTPAGWFELYEGPLSCVDYVKKFWMSKTVWLRVIVIDAISTDVLNADVTDDEEYPTFTKVGVNDFSPYLWLRQIENRCRRRYGDIHPWTASARGNNSPELRYMAIGEVDFPYSKIDSLSER